jgi:hypothetical protein
MAGASTTVISGGSELNARKSALLVHLQDGQQYRVEEGETFEHDGTEYTVTEVTPTGVVFTAASGQSYRIPPVAEGTGRD